MERYESSFKKRHTGKLLWFTCLASNEAEATVKLRKQGETPGHRHKHNGYHLYGGPMKIVEKVLVDSN